MHRPMAKGDFIKTPFRIGIVHPDIHGWMAGPKLLRTLTYSLNDACRSADIELYALCEPNADSWLGLPNTKVASVTPPVYFRGERRLRGLLGLSDKSNLGHVVRQMKISVLLSIRGFPWVPLQCKTVGWIPDFQHVYMPELFSTAMREQRDSSFRELAEQCARVMLSSRNALEHFSTFIPEYAFKGRVISFPSMFAFEPPRAYSCATRKKFNIPAKFALVANQFWRHKNHEVVIEALRLLATRGIRLPVVMIGLPADSRDPQNRPLSQVLQLIASTGTANEITVLGMLSDAEAVNLMRAAAVAIQPSRFEGWSTVVQECKALGRPLICSDIAVHHEQAPGALGFFPCDRPDLLADLLATHWPDLEPGPNLSAEVCALRTEREFARRHGQALLRICQEAHST